MKAILIPVIIGLIIAFFGLHEVDEGHLGLYWRGGALLSTTTQPGYHIKLPFVTYFDQVQVSIQTDQVLDIPCGTSGGVMIAFEKVEVVNRLHKERALETIRKYSLNYDKVWIFDKIHHEINQFCSSHTLQEVYIEKFDSLDESLQSSLQRDCDKWAPGLEIVAVRVTKPRIPANIQKNYQEMEVEKTRLLISIQHQKVVEKEAETEQLIAMIAASQEVEVSRIRMEKEVVIQKAQQKAETIENEVYMAKQNATTNALYYHRARMAEADSLRLTDQYILYQLFQNLKDRPKYYLGSKLSDAFIGHDQFRYLPPSNFTFPPPKAAAEEPL